MTTKEQVLEIIMKESFTTDSLLKTINKIYDRIEQEVQEPKVKQLVWGELDDNIWLSMNLHEQVDINHLDYRIDHDYALYCNGYFVRYNDTLEQAKAYAQEHFEGLIRGCYDN